MKKFEYVVKDELGIHARPATMLVKEAKAYQSKITIAKEDGKNADVKGVLAVMALAVKQNDKVNVIIEGDDEDVAFEGIKAFFETNL